MEQLVFFCVKDSVAAVKMDISCFGPVGVLDGLPSVPGEGGGVGYVSFEA